MTSSGCLEWSATTESVRTLLAATEQQLAAQIEGVDTKLRAELGSVAERAKKAHDEAVHQRRLSDGGDGGGGPLFALLARLRECITGDSASQPPLLPVSVERSDGADASGDELVAVAVDDAYDGAYVAQVEDEDGLKRKRALLGLVLCLLCTAVVMLLAAAGVLLALVHAKNGE